ncbi:hypothetical protein Poli38472_004252 [Pythium oligandrum]|uniref:Uncharacterized protein n=1 Tax=Pythium oligandrum TaxID=41045 RepID=A0A8K1CMW3_PYTOL|nr:hypothetical protein Poli38472_004252 [Pythium oligandrum]|eukprot:TMW66487.1 hypothetical protein Poli38472_004252 [Pythium oligandrum]
MPPPSSRTRAAPQIATRPASSSRKTPLSSPATSNSSAASLPKTRSASDMLSPKARSRLDSYRRYSPRKRLSGDFSDDTYSVGSEGDSPKGAWRIFPPVGGPFLTGPLANDFAARTDDVKSPRGQANGAMDFDNAGLLFPVVPAFVPPAVSANVIQPPTEAHPETQPEPQQQEYSAPPTEQEYSAPPTDASYQEYSAPPTDASYQEHSAPPAEGAYQEYTAPTTDASYHYEATESDANQATYTPEQQKEYDEWYAQQQQAYAEYYATNAEGYYGANQTQEGYDAQYTEQYYYQSAEQYAEQYGEHHQYQNGEYAAADYQAAEYPAGEHPAAEYPAAEYQASSELFEQKTESNDAPVAAEPATPVETPVATETVPETPAAEELVPAFQEPTQQAPPTMEEFPSLSAPASPTAAPATEESTPVTSVASTPRESRSPSYADVVSRKSSTTEEVASQRTPQDAFDQLADGIVASMNKILSRTKKGRTHAEVELSCLIHKIRTQLKIMGRVSSDIRVEHLKTIQRMKQHEAEKRELEDKNAQLQQALAQVQAERDMLQYQLAEAQNFKTLELKDVLLRLKDDVMVVKKNESIPTAVLAQKGAAPGELGQRVDEIRQALDQLIVKQSAAMASLPSMQPAPIRRMTPRPQPVRSSGSWKKTVLYSIMLSAASVGGVYLGSQYSNEVDTVVNQLNASLGDKMSSASLALNDIMEELGVSDFESPWALSLDSLPSFEMSSFSDGESSPLAGLAKALTSLSSNPLPSADGEQTVAVEQPRIEKTAAVVEDFVPAYEVAEEVEEEVVVAPIEEETTVEEVIVDASGSVSAPLADSDITPFLGDLSNSIETYKEIVMMAEPEVFAVEAVDEVIVPAVAHEDVPAVEDEVKASTVERVAPSSSPVVAECSASEPGFSLLLQRCSLYPLAAPQSPVVVKDESEVVAQNVSIEESEETKTSEMCAFSSSSVMSVFMGDSLADALV